MIMHRKTGCGQNGAPWTARPANGQCAFDSATRGAHISARQETGQAVIELLFAMNQDAGTTLVLVTHDDHLASRCARVLRIDSGRLVA